MRVLKTKVPAVRFMLDNAAEEKRRLEEDQRTFEYLKKELFAGAAPESVRFVVGKETTHGHRELVEFLHAISVLSKVGEEKDHVVYAPRFPLLIDPDGFAELQHNIMGTSEEET